jgi:hypothetical protein
MMSERFLGEKVSATGERSEFGSSDGFRVDYSELEKGAQIMLTPDDVQRLRADFESWSGGFPPDSMDQIWSYAMSSRPADFEEEEAVAVLKGVLEENHSGRGTTT